ncbi:hypothetical protein PF002_g29419 [Phytophthora fragariae]|uniref:Uncharacterized protein n=1 Tax=Phytophthora fragariae TaxID=53985 RepID=A0A6A3VVH8_9STRA|nr:hypothetical protein PF002_g29419 [Phytophthora fragariae]
MVLSPCTRAQSDIKTRCPTYENVKPHRKLFAKQAAQANEEAVHSWLTAWVPADCLIIAGQLRPGSEKQATP